VAVTCIPLARLVLVAVVRPARALARGLGSLPPAPAPMTRALAAMRGLLYESGATFWTLLAILGAMLVNMCLSWLVHLLADADGRPVMWGCAAPLAALTPWQETARARATALIFANTELLRKVESRARLVGWLLLGAFLLLALGSGLVLATASAGAYIDTSGSGGVPYARDGQAHVNFSAPSLGFSCHELRTSVLAVNGNDGLPQRTLAQLLAYSQAAITHDNMTCACAPMFGKRRRHLALALPNASIVHMFNVEQLAADGDDGCVRTPDGQPPPASCFKPVREHQRMLFPARADGVRNVRAKSVRVRYETESCAPATAVLRGDSAYCTQTCLDLFKGITVYDRAAARARLEQARERAEALP